MTTTTYPIASGDVVTPSGFRCVVDYFQQHAPQTLELTAATMTLAYGPGVGNMVGNAANIIKVPALATDACKSLHSAAKVATAVATCDWNGTASSAHALSIDLAKTGYDAHCVASFARGMGATSVPSFSFFGIFCLGWAVLNGAWGNLMTIFDSNAYTGTSVQKTLYERNVCKNWWELGDNAVALVYCILFLIGITLTEAWLFLIALFGVIFTFGAYLQRCGMQNYSMNQLLGVRS